MDTWKNCGKGTSNVYLMPENGVIKNLGVAQP